MKKSKKLWVALLCVLLMLTLILGAVAANAASKKPQQDAPAESGTSAKVHAETSAAAVTTTEKAEVKFDSNDCLTAENRALLGLEPDENITVESVQAVQDRINPLQKWEVIFSNGMRLVFDENGRIAAAFGLEDTTQAKTPQKREETLEKIKAYFGLDDSYRVSNSKHANGSADYCFEKRCANGAINIYDSLNLVLNPKNGISVLVRFCEQPVTTQAKISEQDAIRNARQTMQTAVKTQTCQLTFARPDLLGNEEAGNSVRLAYKVTFNDSVIVYIDAVNGEEIGRDMYVSIDR